MSGSVLGADQVRLVNSLFPTLVAHLRSLLEKDHTGVGLMRVHTQVESFDSDEMAKIFAKVSFLSPTEKKAYVRAALYEILATTPSLFAAPEAPKLPGKSVVDEIRDAAVDAQRVFTPPQFRLNAATSEAAQIAKTDTQPAPVVTSTVTPHVSKVADQLKAGAVAQAEDAEKRGTAVKEAVAHVEAQQAKIDAAVAKLRAESGPAPVEE